DAALYASDYVVVVMQTQERSLAGAEVFTNYLQSLIDDYNAELDIIGILPVILKNGAAVDLATLENAKDVFGEENIFKQVVMNMERLKRFDLTGITNDDMHDRRVHKVYNGIAEEFIERLEAELNGGGMHE
ncbi:MAG: ParA family protein, partial [Caryophanon sp.]|nr:ParA family protein [Caryophanon sp.]